MNSKKKGVFSSHNICYVGDKIFKFDAENLLADFSNLPDI